MTPEQKQAIAIASARARVQAQQKPVQPQQPQPQPVQPVSAQPMEATEQPGFIQASVADLSKRKQTVLDYAYQMGTADKHTQQMLAVHSMSEMVRGGWDIAGNAISALTPTELKDWMGEQLGELAGTSVGKNAMKAMKWAVKHAEEYPEATKILGSTATLAGAAGIKQMLSKPHVEAPNSTWGAPNVVFPDYKDLARPVMTKAEKLKAVSHTDVTKPMGMTKVKEARLTDRQTKMAREMMDIKGVKPTNLHQENFNALQKVISADDIKIKKTLSQSKAKVSPQELRTNLEEAFKAKLKEGDPLLSDTKTLKHVLKQADFFFSKQTKNPIGVMKARQEFDRLYNTIKAERFGSGAPKSPLEEMYNLTRSVMNDTIKMKVPNKAYENAMSKQSLLIEAREQFRHKAIAEGDTWAQRHAAAAAKAKAIPTKIIGR